MNMSNEESTIVQFYKKKKILRRTLTPLSILCKNFMMFPLVIYRLHPSSFEAVYCFVCGRRRGGCSSTSVDLPCSSI